MVSKTKPIEQSLQESIEMLDGMAHELVSQSTMGLEPRDLASLAQALASVERLSVDTKIKLLGIQQEQARQSEGTQGSQYILNVPPMPWAP